MPPHTTRIPRPSLALLLLLAPGIAQAAEALGTLGVTPSATFLRTSADPAGAAAGVSLEPYGLCEGDELTLAVGGEFQYGSASSALSTATLAVFSASATLAASSVEQRVVDAIDAGSDVVTVPTRSGGYATDFPQDFGVEPSGTSVVVPAGATHLFLSAHDSYFADNRDSDGDYEVSLAVVRTGNPDGDDLCTADDNCPEAFNDDQADGDGDGIGDACDACPYQDATGSDADGDGCLDDADYDGVGDAWDDCPTEDSTDRDYDGDGCVDVADGWPTRVSVTGSVTATCTDPSGATYDEVVPVTFEATFDAATDIYRSRWRAGWLSALMVASGTATVGSSTLTATPEGSADGDAWWQQWKNRFGGDQIEGGVLAPDGALSVLVWGEGDFFASPLHNPTAGPFGAAMTVAGTFTNSLGDTCQTLAEGSVCTDVVGEIVRVAPDTDGDGITDDVDLCPAEDASGSDGDGDGCIDAPAGGGTTITYSTTFEVQCESAPSVYYYETAELSLVATYDAAADRLAYDDSGSLAPGTYATFEAEVSGSYHGTSFSRTLSGATLAELESWYHYAPADGSGRMAGGYVDVGDFNVEFLIVGVGLFDDVRDELTPGSYAASTRVGTSTGYLNAAGDICWGANGTGTAVVTGETAEVDADGDGLPDADDFCPYDADNDADADLLCADADACPAEDATGFDADFDGCLDDSDGDGVVDSDDLCPGDAGNDADFDGWCVSDGDCDDADAAAYPVADEVAGDGVDQDCDGEEVCYVDDDGDGYRLDEFTWSADGDCDDLGEAGDGAPVGDCDDGNAAAYPDAPETIGNGVDEDCDSTEFCYVDFDGDGFRTDNEMWSEDADCDDLMEAHVTTAAGDCDDDDPSAHPGADEVVADGRDEDCDGSETCYVDADDDGYRTDALLAGADTDCADAGEALAADADGDCADADSSVNPGATEGVGDAVDQDCDGAELCYADQDDDGWRTGTSVASADVACDAVGEAGAGVPSGDCDDGDDTVHPTAEELCDGGDQDCDGSTELATACADECGDGLVATTIPDGGAPTCASRSRWTTIGSAAALASWAANPTTSANIASAIDLGGADLQIVTNCDVRIGGAVSNAGDVAIAAYNVTLNAPVSGSGELLARAVSKVTVASAARLDVAGFVAEAPTVDHRADNTAGGGICAEGNGVGLGADSAWDAGGEPAEFWSTGVLNVSGDVDNASSVVLGSTGRLYHRGGSVLSDAGDVYFLTSSVADLAGLVSAADSVTVDALRINFSSAAVWDDAGDVTMETGDTFTLTFAGDITNSASVAVWTAGTLMLSQNALIASTGAVDLVTTGRFDGRGDLNGNGAVEISARSWKLTSTHDFSGNTTCTIAGGRERGTAAPVGCTPI